MLWIMGYHLWLHDMDYYDNEKIYALYQENLERMSKKLGTDKNDINTKYVSITTLMNRFKVNNGKDVLNVLLTSERLFLYLKDWLSHGGREQMILRKWDDSLCSDKEFRAFIRRRNSNGSDVISYEYFSFSRFR